jgi:phage-related protein
MAGTIFQRISLEGASEIIENFKKLGEAGKEAFEGIQKAADQVKGPKEFTSSFDRIKSTLQDAGGAIVDVGKSITSVGTEFSKFGAAIAGVIAGFVLLGNSAAETADAIEKNAQKVGVTAESYQKLAFAARQTDVDADAFTTSMGRLSKQLEDARDGNQGAIDNFTKLGLTLHDIETLTPDQALNKLADAFSKLPDGVEKSAAAIKVFGRGGIQLIPLLDEGSKGIAAFGAEFDRLTLGLSKSQIELAKTFIEQKHELEDVFLSLKNQIGLIFVPALTEAAKALTEFIANNKATIIGFVQDVKDAFSSLPPAVQAFIGGFVGLAIVIGPVIVALGLFVQFIGFAAIGIGTLVGWIGTAVTAIGGLFVGAFEAAAGAVAFLLTPIGLTILAIAAFVAAVVFLAVETVKHWDEISQAWASFVAGFNSGLSQALGAIKALPASIAAALGDIVGKASLAAQQIVGFFASIPGKIGAAFSSVASSIFSTLGSIIGRATAAANAIRDAFTSAFDALADSISSLVQKILSWLDSIIAKAAAAAGAVANALAGGGGGSGHARGGLIRGPGTATSDSIPAWLSNNEFVMSARAVRKFGVAAMARMNAGLAPGFARGGLVNSSLLAAASAKGGNNGPMRVINLNIGGENFPGLLAPEEIAAKLQAFSIRKKVVSAGRKQSVFSGGR